MAIWYVSLHSSDPAGGDQTTGEVAYTNYHRIGIDTWTEGEGTLANAVEIQFPLNYDTDPVATHVAVGTDADGAGTLLYTGALDDAVTLYHAYRPSFDVGALVVEAEAPGAVVSAALSLTKRRSRAVPLVDHASTSAGSGYAVSFMAKATGRGGLVRPQAAEPETMVLPTRVFVTARVMLCSHHGSASGSGYMDSTERVAKAEEEELVIMMMLAA